MNSTQHNSHAAVNCSGFTLIELLISLLLSAVAVLGLSALQMHSLQQQLEAYQRAQAILLATDMRNRIRANSRAAKAGQYLAGDSYGLLSRQDCSLGSNLSPEEVARFDLCHWNNRLAGTALSALGESISVLDSARGCLEQLSASGAGEIVMRISVAWRGNSSIVPSSSNCGRGDFSQEGVRRVVSFMVVLGDLNS